MFLVTHPEVLADDWLPPVALGREAETREVVRRLDPPAPSSPPPWIVTVAGPSGSGSSTVARRAAREVADRVREATGSLSRLLAVRVGNLRGAHGVATALLRRMDDGFDGRGFPVAEVLAGVLRRVRRERRPTLIVLDDVALGGPDLAPIVRAFAEPDRFLPEGESGLPPLWTVLAGTPEGLEGSLCTAAGLSGVGPSVNLSVYDARTLGAIVRDRAGRALGRDPPDGLVRTVVERAVAEGGGASHAVDLLRHELLGTEAGRRRASSSRFAPGIRVERHVVHAIGQAVHGATARVGEVRRWEAELARRDGRLPLPTTTLWRRIVRLERAGYLRREIRTGGPGGTVSLVRVLTPIDEWVMDPVRQGTRRDDGASSEGERGGSVPGSPARAEWPSALP